MGWESKVSHRTQMKGCIQPLEELGQETAKSSEPPSLIHLFLDCRLTFTTSPGLVVKYGCPQLSRLPAALELYFLFFRRETLTRSVPRKVCISQSHRQSQSKTWWKWVQVCGSLQRRESLCEPEWYPKCVSTNTQSMWHRRRDAGVRLV